MPELLEQLKALPPLFQWLVSASLAGLWGSFLNMAIWRIPRGESIVWPRSHCPVCSHVLGVRDLVPLFSYLWLRGKCGYCKTRFGPRYFLIELLLVVLVSVAYLRLGWSLTFVLVSIFCWLLILVVGILLHRRLDQRLLSYRNPKAGFTFIEIMLSLMIVAAIIIPFGNIFISSYGRAMKNKEYFMGWNLLESKLEELKLIPFNRLRSDYDLYIKTARKDDNIFVDERLGHYQKMRDDREVFNEHFSDVFTRENSLPDVPLAKFQRRYKEYYGIPFEYHGPEYRHLRRVVKIEPVKLAMNEKFKSPEATESDQHASVLKITVTVTIDSPTLNRKLEASMFRSK